MEPPHPLNPYDFCVAWNWEYDATFAALLNSACAKRGASFSQVTPENLAECWSLLADHQLSFRVFLDRASEDDERFMPLVRWACEHCAFYINRHEQAARSWDKAAMHYRLIHAGIYTPHTIILPAFAEEPVISPVSLHPLGERFIIKPSDGSGGEGVVMDVTSLNQVLALRRENPSYRYLLQTFIEPRLLNRPAWFRVLYCRGEVYPCWWDLQTHIYTPVTLWEESQYHLEPLHEITRTIAALCGLDLFSTEIALTVDDHFVVIDYVNDQPDLRRQSEAVDGVPDAMVQDIAERLAELVTSLR